MAKRAQAASTTTLSTTVAWTRCDMGATGSTSSGSSGCAAAASSCSAGRVMAGMGGLGSTRGGSSTTSAASRMRGVSTSGSASSSAAGVDGRGNSMILGASARAWAAACARAKLGRGGPCGSTCGWVASKFSGRLASGS